MLFAITRIILGITIFIIGYFSIGKIKSINAFRKLIITFMLTIILTTLSALIPLENVFVTFSSPESAYNYNHSGKVKLIVNGSKTDFIVGEKNGTDVYLIVPKSDNGWKQGLGLDTKRICDKISDGITVYVYQYKSTDDYYIVLLNTNGGPLNITDNNNSEFIYSERPNSILNKTFYTYYAYLNSFNRQYTLTVNGENVSLFNQKHIGKNRKGTVFQVVFQNSRLTLSASDVGMRLVKFARLLACGVSLPPKKDRTLCLYLGYSLFTSQINFPGIKARSIQWETVRLI